MKRAVWFLALALLGADIGIAKAGDLSQLPLTQSSGPWDSGHVQGIAVDIKGGYIYYSFTNMLAKYDFKGKLIGTLNGWNGHLGDMDFNPQDGMVYGSLEYKKDNAFYIAIIDVNKIDHIGINAAESEIFRTVYLPEVVKDYRADLNHDGISGTDAGSFQGNPAASNDHHYGCSGIDGIAFGPKFGQTNGKNYLTIAYGIYGNNSRHDNDNQVLLQYDVKDWQKYQSPLREAAPHHNGPTAPDGKYFVRTGNTTYGVQNLAYDNSLGRWFMGVYQGKKPEFPNYLLFAIDAKSPPKMSDLIGVPDAAGKGWEKGLLLPLAADGLADNATGIRGWNQKADVGMQPLGHGLFYLALNSGTKGQQSVTLNLMRWTGDANTPFTPVNADDLSRITH